MSDFLPASGEVYIYTPSLPPAAANTAGQIASDKVQAMTAARPDTMGYDSYGAGLLTGVGILATVGLGRMINNFRSRYERVQATAPDPDEDPHCYKQQEKRLKAGFVEGVQAISLLSVIQLGDCPKLPKGIDRFKLVPLIHQVTSEATQDPAGSSFQDPSGVVEYNYRYAGKRPYLDRGVAIGLTRDNLLLAVAGAGIDCSNRLTISQIQGVNFNQDETDTKARFKSGLHSGFLWRDSLVKAWVELAQKLDFREIFIQSYYNNRWPDVRSDRRMAAGYDRVAERMGFVQDEKTKNWSLELSARKPI